IAPSAGFANFGPARNTIHVVKIFPPDSLAALAGVPAIQVAIGAESVEEAGLGVVFRRGSRPRIRVGVSQAMAAVAGTSVADRPPRFAHAGIEAVDSVFPVLPTHAKEPPIDDER